MKRAFIGSSLLFIGTLETVGIMLCAVLYLPHVTAWYTTYPSKMLFLIFAGKSSLNDGTDGLGLGIFFVVGILFMLLGLVMLGAEYFRKEPQ